MENQQSEIIIRESVMHAIHELKPSPYNPRTIKPEKKEQLRASLKKSGIVQPLIVNKLNMQVIGGHQRLEIMLEENMMFAPVVFLELNEQDEMALNLQLNAIAGEWDWNKLTPMVKNLKSKKWDVNQLGFDFATVNTMLEDGSAK